MCECEDPRTEDNLGVMICFHTRYNLGDRIEPSDEYYLRTEDFQSWEDMEKYIWDHFDPAVVLPVYMIDHSGLGFSVESYVEKYGYGFHWDSGQVGFIFAPKERVRERCKVTRISKYTLQRAKETLISEVEEYDRWHRSECCDEDEDEDDEDWSDEE